jgi:hypothetical protein
MNKNKKIVIIAFIVFGLFSFTSCQYTLKTFYGIKKQKVETENSLKKYLKRKDINSDNIYTVNQNDLIQIAKQIGGVPDILIFDKNGKNIIYKEEGQCNAYAFNFIEELSNEMTSKLEKILNKV